MSSTAHHPAPGGGESSAAAAAERLEHFTKRMNELKGILEVRGLAGEEKDKFISDFLKEHLKVEGSELGWANDTSEIDKINDVELLSATGYDHRFVQLHHMMGELLDANYELSSTKTAAGVSQGDLYAQIRYGADGTELGKGIFVSKLDEEGEETGEQINLYDYAHWKKIKEFLALLHPEDRAKFSISDLEKQFYNTNEPIPVTITKRDNGGNIIKNDKGEPTEVVINDLRGYIMRTTISAEEFEEYFETIKKCQPSLQYFGKLRDDAITRHHAENAGHTQFLEGPDGEYLYMPVTGQMAGAYVRGDVAKTTPRHRAEGHPHEIGYYEENTGICVGFDAAALSLWRKNVTDYQVHQASKERTINNLMGLNSQEAPLFDAPEQMMWFGRREMPDGKVKYGRIYDAMHHHYDQLMKDKRGYAISNDEIGDKIVTDMMAVHFAIAPRDWLMTFGKVSGFYEARDITSSQNAVALDNKGRPRFVVYAKRPSGKEVLTKEQEYPNGIATDFGKIEIQGFTAFAKYMKWRVTMGDVPGVTDPETIDVDFIKKFSSDKNKKEGEKEGAAGTADVRPGGLDHSPDAPDLAQIVCRVFGNQAGTALDMLAGKSDVKINYKKGTSTATLGNAYDLQDVLTKCLEKNADLRALAKKIINNDAGVHLSAPLLGERLIEILTVVVMNKDGLKMPALADQMKPIVVDKPLIDQP